MAGFPDTAERSFRAAFGAFNTRENMDAHCASAYGEARQAAELANPGLGRTGRSDRKSVV